MAELRIFEQLQFGPNGEWRYEYDAISEMPELTEAEAEEYAFRVDRPETA